MHRTTTTTLLCYSNPVRRAGASQPLAHGTMRKARPGGYSHPPHTLVHAGLINQHHDLGVGEVGVLLGLAQLLDLDVGQLHLLLRVYHLGLQLREGLRGKRRPSGEAPAGRGPPAPRYRGRWRGPRRTQAAGAEGTGPAPPGTRGGDAARREGPVPSSAPGPRAPPSCCAPRLRGAETRRRALLRMRLCRSRGGRGPGAVPGARRAAAAEAARGSAVGDCPRLSPVAAARPPCPGPPAALPRRQRPSPLRGWGWAPARGLQAAARAEASAAPQLRRRRGLSPTPSAVATRHGGHRAGATPGPGGRTG